VDGAIHRAGGPAILAECKDYRATHGMLPTGKAIITTGGNLKAHWVIHTVGPVWRGGQQEEAELLASAYRESLRLAHEKGLAAVSFPSISTGAYGYPVEQAAPVALGMVRKFLRGETSVRLVRFVLFDDQTLAAYERAAENFFNRVT